MHYDDSCIALISWMLSDGSKGTAQSSIADTMKLCDAIGNASMLAIKRKDIDNYKEVIKDCSRYMIRRIVERTKLHPDNAKAHWWRLRCVESSLVDYTDDCTYDYLAKKWMMGRSPALKAMKLKIIKDYKRGHLKLPTFEGHRNSLHDPMPKHQAH